MVLLRRSFGLWKGFEAIESFEFGDKSYGISSWYPRGKYGYQALEPSTTAYLGMNGGDESAYVSQGHRTDDYDDDAWYASTPGEDQNEEGWNAWTELPGRPVGFTAHEEDQIASDEETAVALNALEECDFENFPDATAQAIQLQRDRKKRLQEIKSRSKCLKCGQVGEGGKNDSKSSPKPGTKQAFMASAVPDSSDSDDDLECVDIDSGTQLETPCHLEGTVPLDEMTAVAGSDGQRIAIPAASAHKVCGKVEKQKKMFEKKDPTRCAHVNTSKLGSNRATAKTFCKDCGHVIDEMPQKEAQRRRQTAQEIESTTSASFDRISNIARNVTDEVTLDATQTVSLEEEFRLQVEDYIVSQTADGTSEPTVTPKELHKILNDHDLLEEVIVSQEAASSVRSSPGDRRASCRWLHCHGQQNPDRTTGGRVPLVLEEVDIFDHEDVFGVLDDGANSSVCSRKWCENAEKKLLKLGFERGRTPPTRTKALCSLDFKWNRFTHEVNEFRPEMVLYKTSDPDPNMCINLSFYDAVISIGEEAYLDARWVDEVEELGVPEAGDVDADIRERGWLESLPPGVPKAEAILRAGGAAEEFIEEIYQCFNIVDLATGFQQLLLREVTRESQGPPPAEMCLEAFQRWLAWAGLPRCIMADRGSHNRGCFMGYLTGRCAVRRDGGPLDVGQGADALRSVIQEVASVKNMTMNVSGFSRSQWVLGRNPRGPGTLTDEQAWNDIGAMEGKLSGADAFALRQKSRLEAKKAMVKLDTSRRTQKALTKNAAPIKEQYKTGDYVVYRRDAQAGGTKWSTTSRVIGQETAEAIWVVSGGIPVLCSVHSMRPASEEEDPDQVHATLPFEGERWSIGSRGVLKFGDCERDQLRDLGFNLDPIASIAPNIAKVAEQESSSGEEASQEPKRELNEAMSLCTSKDHWKVGQNMHVRVHVAPRRYMYEPNSDDFPGDLDKIRYTREGHRYFEDGSSDVVRDEWGLDPDASGSHGQGSVFSAFGVRALWICQGFPAPDTPEFRAFVAERSGPGSDQQAGKKPRKMNDFKCEDHVKEGIKGARKEEWEKYQRYNAAIPIQGEMLQQLLNEGHKPIPSQWIDVDKNEHQKGSEDYRPKYRSRLVACGHLEHVDRNELDCDSPTADAEVHCLIASYAASRRLKLRCGDITSAYFQDSQVPEEAMLLCRLPIYGTIDAGCGFYNRLSSEAKGEAMSWIAPGLYYLLGSDGLPAIILATHVDNLLWCATPEGTETMERILAKFDVGRIEDTDFRFCGRRFRQAEDFSVRIDAGDNTRQIRKINIPAGRKATDHATEAEEANRVAELAQADQDRSLYYP
ncbi:unnamed protein product, partial [Symbiodinium necroappetens]